MSRKCIFCRRTEGEFDNKNGFTVEHIIPEALGNKTLLIHDVCKDCNSKLGNHVDGEFVNSFPIQIIRFEKGLRGKGGEVPNPFKRTKDKDGNIVLMDDELQPKVVLKIDEPDVDGRVHAVAPDKDSLIRALEKKFDRLNIPAHDREVIFKQIELKKMEAYSPELQYYFTVDFNRIWIEMLKIAYEYAFLKLGEKYFDDHRSKEIRNILKSEIDGERKVYQLKDLGICDLNVASEFEAVKRMVETELLDDSHIVILGKFWDKLYVLISLFSGDYLYLVNISDNPELYGITEEYAMVEKVQI